MSLESLQFLLKHMDANKRFEIVQPCPFHNVINLSLMEFKTTTEKKCDFCGHFDYSTTIQHVSILKQTRHETVNNLLIEQYSPQSVSKCFCGGDVVEKRIVEPIGFYHFMIVQHEFAKFSNLKSDETFKMFGCSWRIISFAQYLPEKGNKGKEGHYVTWINTGVDWMCVNDNDNVHFYQQ